MALTQAALQAIIDANIYTNTTKDITGDEMNEILTDLNDSIGALVSANSGIAPYDPLFPYVGGETYYVSDNGNIFKFTSLVDSTGDLPPTPPATNSFWELSSVGAALAAGAAINMTVAAATAAAAAGALKVGALYRISDAYGDTAIIWMRAYRINRFEPNGTALYLNASMDTAITAIVGYDLTGIHTGTADYIFYLHDVKYNNRVYQSTGTDLIGKIPFGNLYGGNCYFKNNIFSNVAGTWTDCIPHILGVNASECTMNLTGVDDTLDCIDIVNVTIQPGSTVTLSGDHTAYSYGTIDGVEYTNRLQAGMLNGTIIGVRTNISGFNVADSTIDTTNCPEYVGGGELTLAGSSFVALSSLHNMNPDGAGVLDLANVPFAGVLVIDSPNADIITISNFGSIRKAIEIYLSSPFVATQNFLDFSVSFTGNLFLLVGTMPLTTGLGTRIKFIQHPHNSTYLMQTGYIAPITQIP